MVSNIVSGASVLSETLASVAAWMTCVNGPSGKAKSRTSPLCKRRSERPARCGTLRPKAAALRVSTTASAPRPSASLAQAKLSSSQQPKKPVPPVMNRRPPAQLLPQAARVAQHVIQVVGERVRHGASRQKP